MDGVLTDGTLLILDERQFLRTMHIKDGYALQLAVKKGYRVVIISGAASDAAMGRLQSLGIKDVYMKVEDKKKFLQQFATDNGLQMSEMLFMGDDIPDYQAMKEVGLPCAPADAVAEIKDISRYISPVGGGQGCVRDVIEKVLKLHNQWPLTTDIASR